MQTPDTILGGRQKKIGEIFGVSGGESRVEVFDWRQRPLSPVTTTLQLDLRSQLHNSVRRNIEKLRRRPRVPRHEDEKLFSPHRQRSIALGQQSLTTEVVRRLRRNSDNSFLLTAL